MWHAKRRQKRYETIQDRNVRHDNKTLDVCDMPREDRRGMTIQDRQGVRHDNKTLCMWHARRRQTLYETIQDRRGVRLDNKTVDVCDIEDRRCMRQYKTGEVLDLTTRH